jgi:hypothetical protein
LLRVTEVTLQYYPHTSRNKLVSLPLFFSSTKIWCLLLPELHLPWLRQTKKYFYNGIINGHYVNVTERGLTRNC